MLAMSVEPGATGVYRLTGQGVHVHKLRMFNQSEIEFKEAVNPHCKRKKRKQLQWYLAVVWY